MAPMNKITKKEQGLKHSPWITYGIRASMRTRDSIYKQFVKETEPVLKESYHKSYKTHRNHIISILRSSKKDYFAEFFEEHHSNVKKTWDGIRDLINVSKKSSRNLCKLSQDNKIVTEPNDIANTMNPFFVNICFSIEAKIPSSKNNCGSYLGN